MTDEPDSLILIPLIGSPAQSEKLVTIFVKNAKTPSKTQIENAEARGFWSATIVFFAVTVMYFRG
jgi:hypothetical protein